MANPMYQRETEFSMNDSFRDANGQAHFPPTLMDGRLMDRVSLSHIKVPAKRLGRRISNGGNNK